MMVGLATHQRMRDGRRLHLQHGPIDIVAEAFGTDQEIQLCYEQGISFFNNVLEDLVDKLDILKIPVNPKNPPALNSVAAVMWRAASDFSVGRYVTPMAAVAGAVADQVKIAMIEGRQLDKLYVNNGGDIALYLGSEATFTSGVVNNQDAPSVDAKIVLKAPDEIGGIATSGWRGRSLSPGVADAVTVLAETAAMADVAATLIAGDVFTDSAAVQQAPAASLRDDTDLGQMLVTTDVGVLGKAEKDDALDRGLQTAKKYEQAGLIKGAYLALQGETRELSFIQKIQRRKVA